MSKKLLQNRISKTVTPDAQEKFRRALQIMSELLGEDTFISDAEYKSLRKIADKLKLESDDVFAVAQETPEFFDETTPAQEVEKDKSFYEFCDACRSMLSAFQIKLDREQNLAGAEYYNACSVYEENVDFKRARGNLKAQNVQAQLHKIVRQRGRPADKVIPKDLTN
jgi:hypothetical protein